jgi:hypothetical protein
MDHSPWEADSATAIQISSILFDRNVRHRVRKSPPLSPIFHHINPVDTI